MSRYIVDARKNQIRILAPDINESSVHFTKVADREIRFGLSAIKNVGEAAVESIIEARKKEGRFKDFFHFLSSVDLRKLNKRMMEALIQAGAFDQLEENKSAEKLRARYLATLESAMEWASKEAQIKEQGQYSLFGDSGGGDSEGNEQAMRPVWQSGDVLTSRQLLDWEKLLMGVYISGSPLDKYEEKIQQLRVTPIYKLKELAPKTTVTVAVLSSEFRELRIKRGRRIGDKMSVLKLEDNTAQVEMVSFPDHHEAFNEALRGSEVLLVHSELDFEDERPKLLGSKLAHEGAPSVQYLKDVEVALPKRITVEMDTSEIDRRGGAALVMEDIAGVLKKYPGPVPVRLLIQKKNHFVTDLNLDKKFSVMPQKNLVRDLEFLNTRCREE